MHHLDAITQSIAKAQEMGLQIVRGKYGILLQRTEHYTLDGTGSICPIGAFLLDKQGRPEDGYMDAAAFYLGVTHGWVDEFIDGFDGRPGSNTTEGFSAGVTLAVLYGMAQPAPRVRAKPRRRKRSRRAAR